MNRPIRAGLAGMTALMAAAGCGPSPDEAGLLIRLTVPPGTEPPVHVVGSFNGWDPGAGAHRLSAAEDGVCTIALPDVRGTVELKFTRGSWSTVEADAAGGDVPNRVVAVPDTGAVYEARVARWRDPCDWPLPGSTATASVSVLECRFEMPQLARARRVWLYLPPDYESTDRRYPVLYMHDGQNVFDAATAYAEEWGVDEALDTLHAEGDPGVIVVAVDNGQELRADEYIPWPSREVGGGGEGAEYVTFLVETLKPYIDARCRTRPGRLDTGVAGSSLGGLVSLYAGLEHPDVFGRIGVFSPAFWVAPSVFDLAAEATLATGTRVYMVTGGREGERADAYAGDHRRMAELLRATAEPGAEIEAVIRPEGTHSERFWRQAFPGAYRWLFVR